MTSPRSVAKWAFIALVCGAVAIAFAPIFTKLAMNGGHIDSWGAALWRVTLATPFMLVWAWRDARHSTPGPRPGRPGLLLLPGTIFAADLAAWHASFNYTTVGNATLLANCAVILVSLYAWLWLKERMGWPLVVGGALALAGVVIVLGVSFDTSRTAVTGDLLALLTAVFYAMYLITLKHLRASYSASCIMAWSTVTCAVWMVPCVLLFEDHVLPVTAAEWAALAAVAIVSQCGGQGLIAYALAHLPASFSAITLLIQPTGAVILGWLIFGDALTPLQAAGAGAVLAGIVLARFGTRPPETLAGGS